MLLLVIDLLLFRDAVDFAPSPDHPLHLSGGAAERDGQELLFVVRRSDAGDRAHFRVRDLAFFYRVTDE